MAERNTCTSPGSAETRSTCPSAICVDARRIRAGVTWAVQNAILFRVPKPSDALGPKEVNPMMRPTAQRAR